MEQGPLHAGFKLSGAGEELGLYSSLVTGNLPVDTVSFGEQQIDVSLGRQPDGNGSWVSFSSPTPGASNSALTAVVNNPVRSLMALNAWPNPFNPSTSISFELSTGSRVKLQVFDIRGRLVTTLCDNSLAAGTHSKVWDGRDGAGLKAASGLYFAMIAVEQEKRTIKLVLLN